MGHIKQTTLLLYLLVLQELSKKQLQIKNSNLAKILNVSPSSVSEMLTKLKDNQYLDENLQLTKKSTSFIKAYKDRIL